MAEHGSEEWHHNNNLIHELAATDGVPDKYMQLKEWQKILADLANKKGWGNHPDEVIFSEKIALIHGEVSELLEAYRNHRWKGRNSVGEEMADIIGRVLRLADIYKIDIEKEFRTKLAINKKRNWNGDQLYIDRNKRNKRKK